MLSVALLLASPVRPDDTKLQQNQVQIDSRRRQQVVTEQKMARFM